MLSATIFGRDERCCKRAPRNVHDTGKRLYRREWRKGK